MGGHLVASGDDISDAALVADALRGHDAAFTSLYRRHERAARLAASSVVRDQATSADVVQDAFSHAFARLATLRDTDHFRPWLLQSVRNLALDHVRRTARGPNRVELDQQQRSTDPGPEDLAELAELVARLADGAVRLSRRDAVALALTVQLGMGPADVALALGVTPNNAKVIVHRARQRLREASGIIETP